jgi:hypothetical protein
MACRARRGCCGRRTGWRNDREEGGGEVVDALPTPDPRDEVNYQSLVGPEQSMLARISPRHCHRWLDLLAIDERWEPWDRRLEVGR